MWSGLRPLPLVPVNVALMSTGKVLMYDGGPWGTDARVWDPTTNTLVDVPAPVNIFCSSLEQLGDGRILVSGGHPGTCHVGLTANNVFDPVTGTWTVLADMAFPRWYPTSTTLPDGRVLVMSGESTCQNCFVSVHEIYNPATNTWTQLSEPRGAVLVPLLPAHLRVAHGRPRAGDLHQPEADRQSGVRPHHPDLDRRGRAGGGGWQPR